MKLQDIKIGQFLFYDGVNGWQLFLPQKIEGEKIFGVAFVAYYDITVSMRKETLTSGATRTRNDIAVYDTLISRFMSHILKERAKLIHCVFVDEL